METGWFKRQYNDIKGNAKWQAILWIGGYVVTITALSSVQKWLHHPATTLDIVLITAVPFLILLCITLIRATRRPCMNIQAHPTGGPSTSIFLNVTNFGEATTFSAFCGIVGHPNGVGDYRRGEFRCGWEDGSVDCKLIQRDETASVLIASFGEVVRNDLSELTLWEVVHGRGSVQWESFRWNQDPREVLPGFDIRIKIVGEKTREPKVVDYTVRPVHFAGPLEMVLLGGSS
jgi:hypothetical protein